MSMLCNLWTDFQDWISHDWSDVTFYVVISILAIIGLLALSSFVKRSYNNNKDGKIKWLKLVGSIILLAIVAVLCVAKFA